MYLLLAAVSGSGGGYDRCGAMLLSYGGGVRVGAAGFWPVDGMGSNVESGITFCTVCSAR